MIKKRTRNFACAVLFATLCSPAFAELNDPPYFNLWSNTETVNGVAGNLASPNAQLEVCGNVGCAAPKDYAIFRTVPTNTGRGSGAIDPFLRFQHNENQTGGTDWEAAFNTNYRKPTNPDKNTTGTIKLDGTQFDPALPDDPNLDPDVIYNMAKDHNGNANDYYQNGFNHALMLGDLRAALLSGDKNYFHFLLDINEPSQADKRTLRLDELAFFVADTSDFANATDAASLNHFDQTTRTLKDAKKKVWDFDDNNSGLGGLMLDNKNNGGAGSGDYDMELLLHKDLFADFDDEDYVYLYNFAGSANQDSVSDAEAGFEEWAFDTSGGSDGGGPPGQFVPEPTSLALFGLGIAGVVSSSRRRRWRRAS